jgi:hypothetical protein
VDGVWVLGVGVAAAASASGAKSSSTDALLIPLIPVYLLGAPIVHFAHGHGGKGAGSLGLRIAAPVFLLAIALGGGGYGGGVSFGAGAAVIAIPVVADAVFIAHEDVPPPGPATARYTPTVSPWADLRHGAAGISLGLQL